MIVSPGFVYLSIKGLMPDAGFFPQYLCINIEVRYFRYSLLFLYLHEYETNSFSKPNPVSGHAISENEPSPEKQVPRPFWRKVSSQRLTSKPSASKLTPPNWMKWRRSFIQALEPSWNGTADMCLYLRNLFPIHIFIRKISHEVSGHRKKLLYVILHFGI